MMVQMLGRRVTGQILRALCLGLAAIGCGTDDATVVRPSEPASAAMDTGGGSGAASAPPCVENPVTHLEIINACSSAVKVLKTPNLTLLNPDGSLPPL
jgi:hypothetical protein